MEKLRNYWYSYCEAIQDAERTEGKIISTSLVIITLFMIALGLIVVWEFPGTVITIAVIVIVVAKFNAYILQQERPRDGDRSKETLQI